MRKLSILSAMFIVTVSVASAQPSAYILTGSDAQSVYGSFQYALENSPTQQAISWQNRATGLTGATIPLRTYYTQTGQSCRDYFTSLQIFGINQQAYGSACRQPQGYWKIINEYKIGNNFRLASSNGIAGGQKSCCCNERSQSLQRQTKSYHSPHSKSHYHSKPRNHIHGNQYQHGKQPFNREMPQAKPKKQKAPPSKLIMLVEHHGG